VPESGHESTAKDLASDRPLTTPKLDGSKTVEFFNAQLHFALLQSEQGLPVAARWRKLDDSSRQTYGSAH